MGMNYSSSDQWSHDVNDGARIKGMKNKKRRTKKKTEGSRVKFNVKEYCPRNKKKKNSKKKQERKRLHYKI